MDKETKKRSSSPELTRRQKLARRALPAIALTLTAGGVGANALHDKAEYHDVGSVTYQLGQGQAPANAVREAVDSMSVQEDGEPVVLDGVVAEGQEVSRELREQTGNQYAQQGDMIEVTISKNGFGNYKVEADPAEK